MGGEAKWGEMKRTAQLDHVAELVHQHGRMAGGEAAVVAMGKLGGREMTAASDLDLIIVYDYAGEGAQSDGAKSLPGAQYYARFTQRLIAALSAATAEGSLYQVDMRLRPSGNQGPVATKLSSFIAYQKGSALRPCAGKSTPRSVRCWRDRATTRP